MLYDLTSNEAFATEVLHSIIFDTFKNYVDKDLKMYGVQGDFFSRCLIGSGVNQAKIETRLTKFSKSLSKLRITEISSRKEKPECSTMLPWVSFSFGNDTEKQAVIIQVNLIAPDLQTSNQDGPWKGWTLDIKKAIVCVSHKYQSKFRGLILVGTDARV